MYRNKKGEDVKLRHVLEKISAWVTEIVNIVDVPVSFDPSGHAALPWAVIKFLVTVSYVKADSCHVFRDAGLSCLGAYRSVPTMSQYSAI